MATLTGPSSSAARKAEATSTSKDFSEQSSGASGGRAATPHPRALPSVPEETESARCERALTKLWTFLRMDWVVRPFSRRSGAAAGSTAIWIKSVFITWLTVGCFFLLHLGIRSKAVDDSIDVRSFILARYAVLASLWALLSWVLVFMFFCGERTSLKVVSTGLLALWIVAACIVSKEIPSHLGFILVLDQVAMATDQKKDAKVMRLLATMVIFVCALYMALRVYLEDLRRLGEDTWTLYPFEEEESAVEYPWPAVWLANVLPVALNYLVVQGYASSAKDESEMMARSVDLAQRVAQMLANYDLKGAQDLLRRHSHGPAGQRSSRLTKPFKELLHNLVSYRAFLPDALFASEFDDDSPEAQASPSPLLLSAMHGQKTCWTMAQSCVDNLRSPSYNLSAFKADVEQAFPELSLYTMGGVIEAKRMSSGRDSREELDRTMGALYSVYCIARLDMDGKEVFCFGVNDRGIPLSEPRGEKAEAKRNFWSSMTWEPLRELFVRAELLLEEGQQLVVNKERMMGFLVLTVVHDIMKNCDLLPRVQPQDSPYHGMNEGEEISDHDMALAYVMERFPWLLPSYRDLAPAQRAPILFTQGTMNFNNGWLVQGEAPPGLLFSTFKQVIVRGKASEADVAFYFAHWLTDLAGAEPFNAACWPGAEKFTIKFPLRVLRAFLDSFFFVDRLASASEVEVMESYLQSRWDDLGLGTSLSGDLRIAAMRIALMAQGFEEEATQALAQLPLADRAVLEVELARTGCKSQFQLAPKALGGVAMGPAICVYYSPALVQNAGKNGVYGALLLLAAVFRAAREMFPLGAKQAARTVVIRIDELKAHSPAAAHERAPWLLQRTGRRDAKAVRADDMEVSPSHPELPALLRREASTTGRVQTHESAERHQVAKMTANDEEESLVSGVSGGASGGDSRLYWIDRVPIRFGDAFTMWLASTDVDLSGL